MSHNYIKGGSKGNCTPVPVNGDKDFTVGGNPEVLGEDGKADVAALDPGERGVMCPSGYKSPGSPDEALSEFTGIKTGSRSSSLKKYDGEKTSIPK